MTKEKAKISRRRKISFVLLMITVVLLICMRTAAIHGVKVVDQSMKTDEYEFLDHSTYTLDLKLNAEIYSGKVTVGFYDAKGNLLQEASAGLFSKSDSVTCTATFFSVDKKVEKYTILSFSALPEKFFNYEIFGFVPAIVILAIYLLSALIDLSCKVYRYNGNEIVVYAGWYHHYLKVNGQKVDESNTLSSYSPIFLNTVLDDDTVIEANFSAFNHRISLKINSRLYLPC